MRTVRFCGLVLVSSLLMVRPAAAQLFSASQGSEKMFTSPSARAAYDPVHDCYFEITGSSRLEGRFFDRAGRAVSGFLLIDAGEAAHVAAVVYSPDVSDGAGGFGGVVVVWSHDVINGGSGERELLFAQIVSFPGRLVGTRRTIFAGTPMFSYVMSTDVAYSPTDRVFLVALSESSSSPVTDQRAWIVRLGLDLQPLGQTTLSSSPNLACLVVFFFRCHIGVAWNPTSREFGVLYRQGALAPYTTQLTLARVRSDLTVVGRTAILRPGAQLSGLAVNSSTGNYLAVASFYPSGVDGAEVGPDGTVLASGPVTTTIQAFVDRSFGSLTLSYLPASGTFLLAGWQTAAQSGRLLELNQHGVALSSTLTMLSGEMRQAAHATSPEWLVVVGNDINGLPQGSGSWIIGTSTPFGGSNATLSTCATPDPFVSLGGGVCLNGGWLPPGHPLIASGSPAPSPPPPPPPTGACTIPDPFTSIGGGVCVNGGWVPRGHPLAGGGL